MHEAVADLVAVVMSFRSRPLCVAILEETRGSIEDVGTFSSLAEEFGMALDNVGYLRDLRSPLTMVTAQHDDIYSLSQVLSGALYAMIIGLHDRWWRKFSGGRADAEYSASGKALAIAADHFKRMIFRALDYLPPAEVSFADYGRAIIAADQASHPEDDLERQFIREEFIRRGIVSDARALEVETDYEHDALKEVDLEALVQDDGTAQEFVDRNRALLHIPRDAAASIEPRLDVTKLYYHRGGGKRRVRECLLKVGWRQKEANPIGGGWPTSRWVRVGTTLAIDWKTKRIRALLSTNPSLRPEEAQGQWEDRNLFLGRLAQNGILQLGEVIPGLTGRLQIPAVHVRTSEDVMEIGLMANMLHFPK